ncbi:hypothetical protein [Candidatus Nitrotoga sp. HW29]|nr:hypothetical protein [Candidatus Nitrotoga sp. HW29]
MSLTPKVHPLTGMKNAKAKSNRMPLDSEAKGVALFQSIIILI